MAAQLVDINMALGCSIHHGCPHGIQVVTWVTMTHTWSWATSWVTVVQLRRSSPESEPLFILASFIVQKQGNPMAQWYVQGWVCICSWLTSCSNQRNGHQLYCALQHYYFKCGKKKFILEKCFTFFFLFFFLSPPPPFLLVWGFIIWYTFHLNPDAEF